MAMIPVNIVLETMASLVAEEIRLLGGVRQLVDELCDDLDSMRSFLHDAENRSESNQGIKTWVKQVRDAAYDAEDVVEEFLLRLSLPGDHGLAQSLGNCFLYIRQLRAQHKLAVQIRTIKLRIKAISTRREAFSINKINVTNSSLSTMEEWRDPRLASLYIDEADVVGIENPKSTLLEWLVEGKMQLTSVSIVGMGGLGKTTLVRKVYDSQVVRKWFDCHSWVTVSKSFTLVELLQAMLRGFVGQTKDPAYKEIEQMRESQLIDALRNYLQRKRYVIVFDDIWSINPWESVRFALPDSNCGSRVMFTTRLVEVAASIEIPGHVYQLEPLQEKEAWTLFCMKAFQGENEGVCPKELEALSRSILKKCGGLPLGIVAIGGLLSKKNKLALEWKRVLDSLAAEIRSDGKLNNLEKILLLSYSDLPHYLKSCYLYMSAFPEDYEIRRMSLIRLWTAERLVEEKQGFTMDEVAESYLNELVNRSLIQVVKVNYFHGVKTCRLHDLLREILQVKSREESLIVDLNQSGNMSRNENVRRITIHDNFEELPTDKRFTKLRSVLAFTSIGSSPSISFSSCQRFRLLRVLRLENVPLVQFPLSLVNLVLLRYLSLRKTKIKEIPDSIRKLKNLEVLDLKFSLVSSLPYGIVELERLQQLSCYHYAFKSSVFFADTLGTTVPTTIGKLTTLQKMTSVEADTNGALVRELGKLTQLKRLGILKLRDEHVNDLCYTLQRLKHLSSLYMVSINPSVALQLNHEICPPEFLQRLYLKCGLPSLPKWISSLQYLAKLFLQNSELKEDPLEALQALPSLVVLELRRAYDGEELRCKANAYQKLKKLGVHLLKKLEVIKVEEGAMPELRELDITACWELETVPFGIEHLKKLTCLQLWGMSSSFFQKIERTDGEDFWRVQHIPLIT